jgi:hypothetical protein
MKTFVTLVLSGSLLVAGTAFADANAPQRPPRVYTGIHQPNGRPTKVSSFAPRPGGTKRRIYGAPIQSPIFKSRPQPKKPIAPSPKAPKGR